MPICPVAGNQKNGWLDKGSKKPGNDAVRMSMLSGSTASSSYDRSHITDASSSATEGGGPNGAPLLVSSSSLLCYPRETLNSPPSPATTAESSRKSHHNYSEDYCCSSSGTSRYCLYRHYRALSLGGGAAPPPPPPPPPPTYSLQYRCMWWIWFKLPFDTQREATKYHQSRVCVVTTLLPAKFLPTRANWASLSFDSNGISWIDVYIPWGARGVW
jgi:hypothetical protein